jgi:tetratricopeptide (TPR) repeat protein
MPPDLAKLQSSPRDAGRWQKAQQQLLNGRQSQALPSYRDLARRFPGVVQLWFELGIAATNDLDFALADQAFQRAEQLAPGDASLLVLLGQQYHRLRRAERARGCFERAVVAEPDSIHARLSLAAWFERERRLDEACECVEIALTKRPRDTQARCLHALLLHRRGCNTAAETRLRDLIREDPQDANVKISTRHLLAVINDEFGNYTEALRWLLEAKAEARKTADIVRLQRDYDQADARRRELLASLTPAMMQRWRQEARPQQSPPRLAFLGGHPRSGTTLLEQVLGAHPDIAAFDEPDAFVQEIWNQLAPMNAAQALTANALDHLPSVRRDEFRRRYFKSLGREPAGKAAAAVWLDKNPSPTTALHFWLRVFPELKVIIALRDPRDVVISCFFQNLMLTSTNVNFLDLDRTVRHYADLMDVWLRMKDLGGFAWIESRYEDVVTSLDAEGRRVTEFLGQSWHPQQASYYEAAAQKVLFAPTYNEVTKPVHNRAIGRWQHYAAALAPVQERLAPYCRAFGYSLA